MARGARVFTSNVDGHFQRAGFAEELVTEVHGSIRHAQCLDECGIGIFSSEEFQVPVDEATFRTRGLPRCPGCRSLARPNILMFGDCQWDEARTEMQRRRQDRWLDEVDGCPLVVIELGAGTTVPTVRRFSEALSVACNAPLIRINLREPGVPPRNIGLGMSALAGLRAIEAELERG
jgi:NAD-dependent SIR2 family protein deacetylase